MRQAGRDLASDKDLVQYLSRIMRLARDYALHHVSYIYPTSDYAVTTWLPGGQASLKLIFRDTVMEYVRAVKRAEGLSGATIMEMFGDDLLPMARAEVQVEHIRLTLG